ncbi:hypothetical protein [Fusobacterium sp. IOR10]|uniref:hypothetical protein n=1 Tax=Fusobacterium sp. IOR10 TaxID=2665157 RepID=UPI0013D72BE7|nr:hypothetical protein [Fusobacterium sp. IOR10]
MRKIKKLIISIILFSVFSGCTSLTTYVGEKRIESALKLYNLNGVTSSGIEKLASGLKYIPDSQIGIENFNKQAVEISREKDNILKKKFYSVYDMERLKTYITLNEEASKLKYKIKSIQFNSKDYISSRAKINKVFIDYVVNDSKNLINLPRKIKIEKINYYKGLNSFINNNRVYNIISSLEFQVTKQVYLTSSFRHYNHMNQIINESLIDFTSRNKNREIEKYVYLNGYRGIIPINTNNYVVDMIFSECRTYSKDTTVEKKIDKEIITEHKKLVIKGTYKLFDNNGGSFIKSKYFEIYKDYDVVMEKYKNKRIYKNEEKEIMKILRNEFNKIIIRDLKELI